MPLICGPSAALVDFADQRSSTMLNALQTIVGLAYKVGVCAFEELTADYAANYRAEDEYDIPSLYDIVMQDGRLTDALVLNIRADGSNIVIRGNRRLKVGELMKVQDPEAFKKIFTQVPVHVYEGLTPVQEAELRLDHTGRKPLTKWGLFLAMEDHFQRGKAEADIAVAMNPVFKASTNKMPKLLAKAEAETNFKARRSLLSQCWRQRTQTVNQVTKMPDKVRDAYELYLRGKVVAKGIPRINGDRVGKLSTAMLADKEANAKYNKTNPGPEFTTTWKSFVKEDDNPTESKSSRKTVKDIEQQGERSTSGLSRWWAGFATNSKAEGEFTILDRSAHIGEVVQAANPKLWAEVEKAYHDAKAKVDKAE